MAARRPYRSLEDLERAGEQTASKLADDDWLEAFAAHPKIGDRSGSAWSQQEQSAAKITQDDAKEELARLNQEYLQRFGFIFIVCATGKSANEILTLLRRRLTNTREAELKQAAKQQQMITNLRLRKLLGL